MEREREGESSDTVREGILRGPDGSPVLRCEGGETSHVLRRGSIVDENRMTTPQSRGGGGGNRRERARKRDFSKIPIRILCMCL